MRPKSLKRANVSMNGFIIVLPLIPFSVLFLNLRKLIIFNAEILLRAILRFKLLEQLFQALFNKGFHIALILFLKDFYRIHDVFPMSDVCPCLAVLLLFVLQMVTSELSRGATPKDRACHTRG